MVPDHMISEVQQTVSAVTPVKSQLDRQIAAELHETECVFRKVTVFKAGVGVTMAALFALATSRTLGKGRGYEYARADRRRPRF